MAAKDQPTEWIAGTDVWASFFDGKTKDPAEVVGRNNLRLHTVVSIEVLLQGYQEQVERYPGWESLPKVGDGPAHQTLELLRSLDRSKLECNAETFWVLESCYRLGMGYWTYDQRAMRSAKVLGVPVLMPEAKP